MFPSLTKGSSKNMQISSLVNLSPKQELQKNAAENITKALSLCIYSYFFLRPVSCFELVQGQGKPTRVKTHQETHHLWSSN